MKKPIALPMVILILIGGITLLLLSRRQPHDVETLRLSGNIEVTETRISFRIPGHVIERPVKEGQRVEQGQLAAKLDSTDLEHEVALRQAEVEASRAALADLESGYRPEEIAQSEAALNRARAELERAESDWRRQQELFSRQVISARETESSRTAYQVARARVREASELLALQKKGFRPEQVLLARARLRQAEETLALTQTRLSYATLIAPVSGVVLSHNVEPGEFVVAGTPILTIGALDSVWLRAYFNETDLGRVKLGGQAWIRTDTWPDKRYEGRISFISDQAEFTPRQVQTEKERVKLVYRVKIDIENPHWELKPGMPADAEIVLDSDHRDQGPGYARH